MTNAAFYRSCIQEELTKRSERNSRYSLRAFAKALGFEATVISQILSGKRVPSFKTAQRLIKNLNLSPDETENFLASLADVHRARGDIRVSRYFRKIESKPTPQRELSLDLFRVIADWYHYAILALTLTKDYQSDPKWIAKELSISVTEVNLALDRLLNLGLLEEKNGKLVSSTEGFTTADKAITDAALKRHQKQILEKAIYSLENDPIESRSMSSLTMAVDPSSLPEAKKLIEECTQKIAQLMEAGSQTQVYQLSLALFPVQKRRKK